MMVDDVMLSKTASGLSGIRKIGAAKQPRSPLLVCPDEFNLLSCQDTKLSRILPDHVRPKIGGFGGLPYLGAFFLHPGICVCILCRIID